MAFKHLLILLVVAVVQAQLVKVVAQLHLAQGVMVLLLVSPEYQLPTQVVAEVVYTPVVDLQAPEVRAVVVQVMVLQVPLTQVVAVAAQVLPTILEVQVAQVL
jgi:hypothetical protein